MERIRVDSLQYFIRPVQTFAQFRDRVSALVDMAVDCKCHLIEWLNPEVAKPQDYSHRQTDFQTQQP